MTWDRGAGILPTTHRRMNAEEYYRLPEGPPYFQLIDGELFMSPSPNFFHQEIVGNLYSAIREYLRRKPLGKVIVAPSDVQFDEDNIFQPDVFFISQERLGLIDEQGVKGAPDLVAEVISGSTGRLDLGPKKAVYAEKGVLEFWVLHPGTREVEGYRLAESVDEPAWRLTIGGVVTTPLLPGLEIPVSDLFAR